MRTSLQLEDIKLLVAGQHPHPFAVLGPHEVKENDRKAVAIRVVSPQSIQAWILPQTGDQSPRPMRRLHPAGVFEAICPASDGLSHGKYQLQLSDRQGNQSISHDPYSFPMQLTDFDLYLLAEGKHYRSYEKLGAHLRTVNGVAGTHFCVWAPNATSVGVIGDFNSWDGRRHPMHKREPHGYWELFIPGLGAGDIYKFRVARFDYVTERADPYGFGAEEPPRTASKVVDLTTYHWSDGDWMGKRAARNTLDAPVSVYEMHLGSWMRDPNAPDRWLSYRELAPKVVEYVKRMGYTHVELMPVHEHPFTGSWGYQPVGLYAATSRFGSPQDFMYFVDQLHQADVGVVVDWVPAHFPMDPHGLKNFDGTCLYEHADPRLGLHKDWGTCIYNYGRHEVRNFLISNALFWLEQYHIDGLRVDAVASMLYLDYSREAGEWVPNQYGGRENIEAIEFIKEMNIQVHAQYPGTMTLAEESTAWGGVSRPTYLGGLGFTMKWNMGWMNDTLRYFHREPIHRRFHHNELTFSLIYAFTENFILPLSHDEVVHGKGSLLDKMPGDLWQKFANLRLLYGYMWTHPGKKLLFMGCDFGQWIEWNVNESLQWHLLEWESHKGLQKYVSDMNHLLQREPSLYQLDFEPAGFEWIDCNNGDESALSYIRRGKDPNDFLVVAMNFTPVPRMEFRLGVPENCWYNEVANSDSTYYGGSNLGNFPGVQADDVSWHGRPASIKIHLPPLAVVVFKPIRGG